MSTKIFRIAGLLALLVAAAGVAGWLTLR